MILLYVIYHSSNQYAVADMRNQIPGGGFASTLLLVISLCANVDLAYSMAAQRSGLQPLLFGENSMVDRKPTPARNSQASCRLAVAFVGTGWEAPITPSKTSLFSTLKATY